MRVQQLTRLEKSLLIDYIGMLSSKKLSELRAALRVALSVDWRTDLDLAGIPSHEGDKNKRGVHTSPE